MPIFNTNVEELVGVGGFSGSLKEEWEIGEKILPQAKFPLSNSKLELSPSVHLYL
jgi:hypothetical protein